MTSEHIYMLEKKKGGKKKKHWKRRSRKNRQEKRNSLIKVLQKAQGIGVVVLKYIHKFFVTPSFKK